MTRWICAMAILTMAVFTFSAAATTHADATSTDATTTQGTTGETQGATSTDTVVTSGEATSQTDTHNQVNTNIASTTADGSANSSTESDTNTNAAEIGAESTSTADTGANTATSTGNASASSGNAIATSNVINVANTNIFDSDGLIMFLTQLLGGAPDLRTLDLSYFFGTGATTTCTFLSCGASDTQNVIDTNTATVTNEMLVRASTGGNSADAGAGDATSTSGNAYAVANLVNLVNTNIIDSKYLLLSFNMLGNLNGDITLPDADFWKKLFQNGSAVSGSGNQLNAATDNQVAISGTSTADAQTGGNSATSDATSTATSGVARAAVSSFTQANTTQVGGTSVFLLFRVLGNWSGSVQGLPDGITWQQTPDGIVLSGGSTSGTSALLGGSSNALNATTSNTAALINNVHVWALTGENQAHSATGTATASSGNAFAAANTVNLVNTTILGRNWIFAIFNILGDWNGNIAFGHPDLWIGAAAQAANPAPKGSTVIYKITVANKGDADATDVRLKLAFDRSLLAFDQSDIQTAIGDDATGLTWNIGTIRKGDSRDIEYRAVVSRSVQQPILLTASLTSAQTDEHMQDNSDQITIVAGEPGPLVGAIGPGPWAIDPKVTIEKHASVAATVASTTVDYTVEVKNAKDAGPAFLAKLSDQIVGPDGATIYDHHWNLGTIAPGDDITLTYSVQYGTSTALGTYTGTARVTARKKNPVDLYAVDMPAVSASTSVQIVPRGNPILVSLPVAPATTSAPLPTIAKAPHIVSSLRGVIAKASAKTKKGASAVAQAAVVNEASTAPLVFTASAGTAAASWVRDWSNIIFASIFGN